MSKKSNKLYDNIDQTPLDYTDCPNFFGSCYDPEPIEVTVNSHVQGVPEWVAAVLVAFVVVAGFCGFGGGAYVRSDPTVGARIAGIRLQQEWSQQQTAIQFEVIKNCVDKGNIPIYTGGVVDCKPAPAAAPVQGVPIKTHDPSKLPVYTGQTK